MFDSLKIPAQNSVIPETLNINLFYFLIFTLDFISHFNIITVFYILIIVKGIWTYKYRLLMMMMIMIIIITIIIIIFIFNGITSKQQKRDTS